MKRYRFFFRFTTNYRLTKPFKVMLEYVKTVLTKVSFDKRLFEKELKKAIKALVDEEINILRAWCYQNFSNHYDLILNRCFTVI